MRGHSMYIVLADDLTGAMDTGIQFRKYGIQTSVIVSADDLERLKQAVR